MKVSRRWFLGVTALAPFVARAAFDEHGEVEIAEAPALPPAPSDFDTLLSWSAYGYAPYSEPCVVSVFNCDALFYRSGMNAWGNVIRYVPPLALAPHGQFSMRCDSPNVQLEMVLRRGDRTIVSTRRPGMPKFLTLDVESMLVTRDKG